MYVFPDSAQKKAQKARQFIIYGIFNLNLNYLIVTSET